MAYMYPNFAFLLSGILFFSSSISTSFCNWDPDKDTTAHESNICICNKQA